MNSLFRFPFLLFPLIGLVACSSMPKPETTASGEAKPTQAIENNNAAEAYYQQLLSQHGKDCLECLKPLEFNLTQAKKPGDAAKATEDQRQVNVLVALDSSGSMAETAGGQVKMNSAKSAIDRFVNQLPKASNVSLLLYGHKGSSQAADKAVSCAGIETVYPLSPLNSQQFQSVVNAVQPTGYTPIAAALQKASTVFANANGESNRNIVYVVSDGLETCDGDPISAARQLQNSNAKVIVNVIGFDVDNESQKQLKAVAEAGGGKFISVRTAKELDNTMDEFQRRVELSNYRFNSTLNQSNVNFEATRTISNFNFCVTSNLSNERFEMTSAISNARFNKDPNAVHADYVEAQLKKRHEAIEQWRDRVVQNFEAKREVTLDQIQKDLNEVLQKHDRPNP